MQELIFESSAKEAMRFNALNKVVESRLLKLQRFLKGYKDDISYDKKHEVVGAIRELVMMRTVLDQISMND